jgi:DNA-binding transcriptional LysR family regulator
MKPVPLHALRAFAAAARHLSFRRAAEELHVTPAAISHQIKGLEERLGLKLFRRLTREIRLTEEGHVLAPALRDGFERLDRAVERVLAAPTRTVLTVSTITTVAMSWLVPRLPNFQARHPQIEVRISTSQRVVDFAREDFDCAIRYGGPPTPGLARHELFADRFTPLCAPALARKLRRPADLARMQLLDTLPSPGEWKFWLEKVGLADLRTPGGAAFDSTRVALEAASRGLGVAVGDPLFAADEIRAGRLVQPFDLVVSTGRRYWLVHPEAVAQRPKIVAFRDWLLAEAAQFKRSESSRAYRRGDRAPAVRSRSATAGRGPGRGDASGD